MFPSEKNERNSLLSLQTAWEKFQVIALGTLHTIWDKFQVFAHATVTNGMRKVPSYRAWTVIYVILPRSVNSPIHRKQLWKSLLPTKIVSQTIEVQVWWYLNRDSYIWYTRCRDCCMIWKIAVILCPCVWICEWIKETPLCKKWKQ